MKKYDRLLILVILTALVLPVSSNFNHNYTYSQTAEPGKWFIDKVAIGLNNGKSWTNAWTSFSEINWGLIKPGDIIFISGGKDSAVYKEQLNIGASGSNEYPIIITNGKTSGRTGRVIINRNYEGIGINIIDKHDIKIIDLEITSTQGPGISIDGNSIDATNNIYIDSCKISDFRGQGGIFINGYGSSARNYVDSVFIRYNTINSLSYGNYQTDCIYAQYFTNVFIEGNTVHQRNTYVPSHHCDCIQLYAYQGATIKGNFLQPTKNGESNQPDQVIITEPLEEQTTYIYNNILYAPDWDNYQNVLLLKVNVPGTGKYYIYGNTLIGRQTGNLLAFYPTNNAVTDAYIKNNIFYSAATQPAVRYANNISANHIDNNLYFYTTGNTSIVNYGGNRTLSQMRSLGAEINGLNANPLFVNISNNWTLQQNSPAIDGGTILNPPFNTDIVQTVRPQGNGFDIGAYEYKNETFPNDNIPPNILSCKIINATTLEIAFSEALDANSASDKLNYSINNGIIINSVALSSDNKIVTVNTSQHTLNQTYTITVTNIKDLAGNVISSNNSVQYTFGPGSSIGDIKLNVKIFLQGTYQNGSMLTALMNNNFVPESQPYTGKPWFYKGSEILGYQSNNIVDWILVELRDPLNPDSIIGRRAGLLRSDGKILETDGTLGITFNNILYGEYYIAIFHRNHLPVISSLPLSFSSDNIFYDFTSSLNSAFGIDAMAEISPGVFGMYAGNADGNNIIDETDRNDIWYIQNGNVGYLNGDFNLDSGVTIRDINEYWNLNIGKTFQMPPKLDK